MADLEEGSTPLMEREEEREEREEEREEREVPPKLPWYRRLLKKKPPEGSVALIATPTSTTAQALVIGVQGLAAILPLLSNIHCANGWIIMFAMMPLCGFMIAAIADMCGLIDFFSNVGLSMVYAGYFSLALILLLASFYPGRFHHDEGCFKHP